MESTRYFTHVSPRGNRASILANGLVPHEPGHDGNWGELIGLGLRGPRGVYALQWYGRKPPETWDQVRDANWDGVYVNPYNGYRIPGHEYEPLDLWLVDAKGLPKAYDPDWNSDCSRVITTRVKPERLLLLGNRQERDALNLPELV